MFHIIHCDDDREFMVYMERMIKKAVSDSGEIDFKSFNSGEEMLAGFDEKTECDLLILDMQMPGMCGDEVAKVFRKRFEDAVLVFCSGEVAPTTKSFEAEPYRYIMKNWTDEEIFKMLTVIMNRVAYKKSHTYITIEDKMGKHVLKVSNISHVEIALRGCEIYYKNGKDGEKTTIKVNKKIAEISKLLEEYRFASPHKSYLVNLEYVITVGAKELELIDGTKISITKRKVKEFRQAYLKCATKD